MPPAMLDPFAFHVVAMWLWVVALFVVWVLCLVVLVAGVRR